MVIRVHLKVCHQVVRYETKYIINSTQWHIINRVSLLKLTYTVNEGYLND